jgi:hypothetical protein
MSLASGQQVDEDAQQQAHGQVVGAAAEALEEGLMAAEGLADAGRAQPAGDGATAFGEEHAGEQVGQAAAHAGVEGDGQVGDPARHFGWEVA